MAQRAGPGTLRPSMSRDAPNPMTDLALYGPGGGAVAPSWEESCAYCTALATGHYENFSVLTRLVPRDLRGDFAAVYAFCRWSDDLADETGTDDAARTRSRELLDWWRGGLEACFRHAGNPDAPPPDHPVYIALVSTIHRHRLTPEPFHLLIDAFQQDQTVRAYETWPQLADYCTRSANPVGRIVLRLAGVDVEDPRFTHLVEMSDATCTALQLTNFWQDVRRDVLERDRVYLPSQETGISPDELRAWLDRGDDPEVRVRFIRALRPLVERTRELFDKGRPLAKELACPLSPVIWLFGAGGESVLRGVERCGCATLWRRPRLTKARKMGLLLHAALSRPGDGRG